MSGGSFHYAFMTPSQFAEELNVKLDEDHYEFKIETRKKLQEIEQLARFVSALMREVEWLYSGDTGDESFMRRVKETEDRFIEETLWIPVK